VKLRIRNMTAADLDFAVGCTVTEGWTSETRSVFERFLQYDAPGCFIGEVNSRPVGMCVAIPYETSGFFGELIVLEEMRGRSFGLLLTAHALDYLAMRGAANIYLDGDLGAIGLYEKLRFRKICRSLRFRGTPSGARHPRIRPARASDMESIARLDRAAFGDDRSFFLRRSLDLYPDLCFLFEERDRIEGFILGKPGHDLISVGPWLATKAIADPRVLLDHFAAENPGSELKMGLLVSNERCAALLRSDSSFRETEHSWRMVQGPSDHLGNHASLFAIGSPSTG